MQPQIFNIFVGSWNVNQRDALAADFDDWFGMGNQKIPIHLYALCFQEVITVDNVSQNPLPIDLERFDSWNHRLLQHLNITREQDKLIVLFTSNLGGTSLTILVPASIRTHFSDLTSSLVECSRSKTTIKGAVCCSFLLNWNSQRLNIAIAGVHFTADQETENTEARIKDTHTVTESTFSNEKNFLRDHHFSCVAGDFNFRINHPRDQIAALCEAQSYESLLEFDQQTIARKTGRALTNFSEGKIMFPPTYKYIVGTNKFDLSESPSKRSPAYTDRIVYHYQSPISVQQISYSAASLLLSDHKPIFSVFSISC